jgi:dipeptidyl aminopeptidase/acylaminoacyl peptidase
VVLLADTEVREVRPSDNPRTALGVAEDSWMKQRTWEGFFSDLYLVDLDDGTRRPVARKLSGDPSLSPDGRFVLYYQDADWHLYDGERGTSRNLTAELPVPFADEDHDYPSPPPGYSVGGWVAEGGSLETRAVLITDKFDLWQFPVAPADEPFRLTAGRGRDEEVLFRVVEMDPEQRAFTPGERLLLTEYHDRDKSWGFATVTVGEEGVATLVHEPKRFAFVAKAEDADVLVYTRESYTEFPDLRVAALDLASTGTAQPLRSGGVRISDANPQISEFAWGEAELVEWTSLDGVPLQGVLIQPGDRKPGERLPVLVYFYRFFSQRLHDFNEPVVNHRPSFPFYVSHGYAVFLPDIRFEVGRPGLSAVKALVPGVQKLVEMGVADPDAVGLHGHSWSGYQTAFVVTQTNLFKAAVAGAPVSNMTSAYSGIRWGSGLARQFQYERSQSRIGGSLWEARHLYVENSPVFYADRIETPLLIEFGDQDGAVPWTQGIELYLALRRLGKEVIFLQYEGEPHHLERYANKVDYTIRMKEFFDHYLKGEPAPAWMTEGVPYRGE